MRMNTRADEHEWSDNWAYEWAEEIGNTGKAGNDPTITRLVTFVATRDQKVLEETHIR